MMALTSSATSVTSCCMICMTTGNVEFIFADEALDS
jgi:hypothetical protein